MGRVTLRKRSLGLSRRLLAYSAAAIAVILLIVVTLITPDMQDDEGRYDGGGSFDPKSFNTNTFDPESFDFGADSSS